MTRSTEPGIVTCYPAPASKHSRVRHRFCLSWLLPLIVYAAVCVPIYERHRDLLSGDGVAYLRRATYLASGDWTNSVSGYWSPLMVWLVAPWLRAGFDAVHVAHAVNAVLGAGSIIALGLLVQRFTHGGPIISAAAMTAASLFTAAWGLRFVAPDGLMAGLILWYLVILTRWEFLQSRRWQFLAGAVGALAYLAKAYALPFFLLHMPLSILLIAWPVKPDRWRWRCVLGVMAVTMAGFVLVAGPWVAILSYKYERPTISLAASRAHAIVGPVMDKQYYPEWGVPPDPFISHWENPEQLRYDFWRPWSSRDLLRHQLSVVWENLTKLAGFAINWAKGGLAIAGIAIGVLAALTGIGMGRRRELVLLLMTLGIYVGGLLPLFFHERYVVHVAVPLLLLIYLAIAYNLGGPGRDGRKPGLVRHIVAAIVVLSFAAGGTIDVQSMLRGRTDEQDLREAADAAHQAGLRGPLACDDRARGNGVAFFCDVKHIGFPPVDDPAEADRLLRQERVGMLMVFRPAAARRRGSVSMRVAEMGGWRLAIRRGRVEIYAPIDAGGP